MSEHPRPPRALPERPNLRYLKIETAALGSPVPGARRDQGGHRGVFAPSNAGYALLGQLLADVLGIPYPAAVSTLVFDQLHLTASDFPTP